MKNSTKRQKFFEESLILIHQKGFGATSMRDLAQHMGFKVANVYNYIDSKQALLETYLFGISNEFHQGIDNILASSYSPTEKLKALISLNVRLTAQKPYEVALLTNEWRNLDNKEGRLDDFLKEREAYEGKVKQLIQEGMTNGEFRSLDLELATSLLLSSVRWLYDKYTQNGQKMNPIELEKQISDFVLLGLGKS